MTSYTLATRDVPLFYLSLNMSLVVSRSDGKRHRGVLFRKASGKEPGVGQGKRFIAELGRLFGAGTQQSQFGDLRPEFGED